MLWVSYSLWLFVVFGWLSLLWISQQAEGVDAVVQLGDIIDGCNSKLGESEKALKTVLEVLSKSPVPRYDLIGNHELYNLHRDQLQRFGVCGSGFMSAEWDNVIASRNL